MIPGIDVSHHNGVIDWPAVAAAGVQFAYVKLTDGMTGIDPKFPENFIGSKSSGILRGAYHFARPGCTAEQIERFFSLIPSDADLAACIDIELDTVTLADFELYANAAPRVMIYSNPNWLKTHISTETSSVIATTPPAGCSLWIAEYGVLRPAWTRPFLDWTIWQHEIGEVAGVSGDVDLDWLNSDDLASLPRYTPRILET